MRQILFNPWFYVPAIVFVVNQVLEKVFAIYIPYVHAYLDDLLCMPVVLGITLMFFRRFHHLGERYRFSKTHVWVAVLYFSVIFEVWLPSRSSLYTTDWLDVVCYSIGAVVFWYKINLAEYFR
ncbi:magnesium citrate secondary transporter [Penaeicola halotolerans]|uniref:magnesium citrate secondary transporter n=1 Tax=Penaeicola halotolerans TaxID=2793196 RepID=UPI001CF8A601|nr:magnesium citrate secondary transporter [Penaeicola halotolerans]